MRVCIEEDRLSGAARSAKRRRAPPLKMLPSAPGELGEQRMRSELIRRDEEHEAEAAGIVVDDAAAAGQMQDHMVVHGILGAPII